MIDFNKFYEQYCLDPKTTKFEMVQKVAKVLLKAVQENYYEFSDLKELNYSEICDWLGWPDFRDGGFFEQIINIAANMTLGILGYKPLH